MSDEAMIGLGAQNAQNAFIPQGNYDQRRQTLLAEDAATRRRRTRELAMQMALQLIGYGSGSSTSDLVHAAKIIGDFLEGDAG